MSNHKSIYRTDNSFLLTIELPGVKTEDIQIQAQGGKLSIKAERKRPEAKVLHLESSNQSYRAEFPLRGNIDEESIGAKFENGVLYVELKKKDNRYTIPIKAA